MHLMIHNINSLSAEMSLRKGYNLLLISTQRKLFVSLRKYILMELESPKGDRPHEQNLRINFYTSPQMRNFLDLF